jgi:hypothetical protein
VVFQKEKHTNGHKNTGEIYKRIFEEQFGRTSLNHKNIYQLRSDNIGNNKGYIFKSRNKAGFPDFNLKIGF